MLFSSTHNQKELQYIQDILTMFEIFVIISFFWDKISNKSNI